MKIILASSSPRRKELMKEISSSFDIIPSSYDEIVNPHLSIKEQVQEIAKNKGLEIHQKHPNSLVISADTIVVFKDEIIGKPKDGKDAFIILKKLSDNTHEVLTAFYLFYKKQVIHDVVSSKVTFNKMSDELIKEYISSKSPLDKAGAYGVQDNDKYHFIKKVEGSIDNVVGFPVKEIKEAIQKIEP